MAAECNKELEEDARALQQPMTAAWEWNHCVSSNQMLSELCGLTRSYPFCGDVLSDAQIGYAMIQSRIGAGTFPTLPNQDQ
jgi:hypothetical protein